MTETVNIPWKASYKKKEVVAVPETNYKGLLLNVCKILIKYDIFGSKPRIILDRSLP